MPLLLLNQFELTVASFSAMIENVSVFAASSQEKFRSGVGTSGVDVIGEERIGAGVCATGVDVATIGDTVIGAEDTGASDDSTTTGALVRSIGEKLCEIGDAGPPTKPSGAGAQACQCC